MSWKHQHHQKSKNVQTCFWVIAIVLCIASFLLGILAGTFIDKPPLKCGTDPLPAIPPTILLWNEQRTVGTILMYACDNSTEVMYRTIQVCNESLVWETVAQHYCGCVVAPLQLNNSIVKWSRRTTIGETAIFWCSDIQHTKMDSIAFVTKCTRRRRRWEKIREGNCSCHTPPLDTINVYAFLKEKRKMNLDTLIVEQCMQQPNSPDYRSMLCNDTLQWTIVGQHDCGCLNPLPKPDTPVKYYIKWSNEIQSRPIGTEVSYHCTVNPKSAVFLSLKCDFDRQWQITYHAPDNCIPKYTVVPPLKFIDSLNWCSNQGGEQYKFELISNQDFIPMLKKMEFNLNCSLNKYFIGIYEVVDHQWVDSAGNYPSDLNEMWEQGYPTEKHACAIINWKGRLQNVPCTSMQCYICEDPLHSFTRNPQYQVINNTGPYLNYDTICGDNAWLHAPIRDQETIMKITDMMKNLTHDYVNCPYAYVGLTRANRIWVYKDETPASITFWDENEPSKRDNNCVITDRKSNYMLWQAVPCDTVACGICKLTKEQ